MISSDHVSQLLGTLNTIQSSKNDHQPQQISKIRFPNPVLNLNQQNPQQTTFNTFETTLNRDSPDQSNQVPIHNQNLSHINRRS